MLALYGHADAGGFWEEHCEAQLVSIGYERIAEEWPGVYWHEETNALLIVYVDDFKLAAKAGDHDRLWAAIRGSSGSSSSLTSTSSGGSLGTPKSSSFSARSLRHSVTGI